MDAGTSETRPGSSSSHPIDPGGFAPGAILADRYRVVALAGRGGMGEVYRADDLRLGQPVALKFLPATLEEDAAARERLLAEVRNARTISHPNVCRVYDVGELTVPAAGGHGESKGRIFLTMEYIDGEDLASLLRRIGRLPAGKALEIARQLCAGLGAAHDKGVLHRDLKPANVMIDGRGQARITDFGLAVEAAPAGVPADFAGTAAYMAPERFQGAPATVQSDLYALGLILYETFTGKPAFKAGSLPEWQRAHTDSTPASPATLVGEIEAPVDRAILRCLEKDPAKRPASAAQVAAALPGGDPLAAALAAGETPSPELVAASGEEGTLPRWKAWTWLAACLVALVLVPLALLPLSLTNRVPAELSPDALQARAREALNRFGYTDAPADRAWWIRADATFLERLNKMRPGEALAEIGAARPGPLLFCYRESRVPLVPVGLPTAVTAVDPPAEPGDAYVELDLAGRLATLRVVPPGYGDAQPSSRVDWVPLFAAAQLGTPDAFVQTAPRWWPEDAPDARDAREGVYAGQRLRVEAASRAGQPIFFRLLPTWTAPPQGPGTPSGPSQGVAQRVISPMFWGSLVVVALLARRNLRLGRGDRIAARRIAVATFVVVALRMLLGAHSLWLPALSVSLALGLFAGMAAWLYYLGFEPSLRRIWPHLLVSSTRLLDLRWRDPLVGQSVLAGALVGLVTAAPASLTINRALGRPGSGPVIFAFSESAGDLWAFAGMQFYILANVLMATLMFLGLLLVVRLVVRRADAAWAVFALLFVAFNYVNVRTLLPAAASPWLMLLLDVGVFGLLVVWVLWKHGALAFAVSGLASTLPAGAPWTSDMSRWYAWRGPFMMAIIAALAFWGFKNVLGKQSAFPAGTLDG